MGEDLGDHCGIFDGGDDLQGAAALETLPFMAAARCPPPVAPPNPRNPRKAEPWMGSAEWNYSSFHRYARVGVLPIDWAGYMEEESSNFGEPA
jgi:hypothetical protein